MKITKITKKKNNMYNIILSDKTSLSFYDDTIIKFNLLKPREITEKEVEEAKKYNDEYKAYHIAIRYITTKLRTRKEIRLKLKEYDNTIINKTIKRLEKDGYINDDIYIKSFISDQINLTLNGPEKIIKSLSNMEFKYEDIIDYLNKYDSTIWIEKINKLITKKINSNHKLSKKMLINKIKKDLINLGYNKEIINSSLANFEIKEDSDLLEKEATKELKRLSKKYEGINLKIKLKQNLFRKGFNFDLVDSIVDKLID